MNIKKILGSFICALIISAFLNIGQNSVYACGSGNISVTNNPVTEGKFKYSITLNITDAFSGSSCSTYSPKIVVQKNVNGYISDVEPIDLPPFLNADGTDNANWKITRNASGIPIKAEYLTGEYIPTTTNLMSLVLYSGALKFGATGEYPVVGTSDPRSPVTPAPTQVATPGVPGAPAVGPTTIVGPVASTYQLNVLIRKYVEGIYNFVFPIALVIAIIKILINLIQMGASQGDPNKLTQIKEELTAIALGILTIGGAVTLIRIIASTLGV